MQDFGDNGLWFYTIDHEGVQWGNQLEYEDDGALYLTELAEDHDKAVITREMWEERSVYTVSDYKLDYLGLRCGVLRAPSETDVDFRIRIIKDGE